MTLRIDGVPTSTSHYSFHDYHTDGQCMCLSSNLSLARAGAEAAVNKKGRGLCVGSFRNVPGEGLKGVQVRGLQWLP